MADAVWVGVDLGTQSVRTVAVGRRAPSSPRQPAR